MPRSRSSRAAVAARNEITSTGCDFARDCEIAQSPHLLEIERRVRGSFPGATSWTTHRQAEAAAARLGLASGRRLLELGAGSGWPALFLAAVSGSEVVITDLPLSGLRAARTRAASDAIDDRCLILDAGGDYAVLLDAAAWSVLERFDVTADFGRCMDVMLKEYDARCEDLLSLLGERDYAERLERRHSTPEAVSRDLLRR